MCTRRVARRANSGGRSAPHADGRSPDRARERGRRPRVAARAGALENGALAERLEAFAVLLELAGANPYGTRAYRRAAELIRSTPVPVADLVRAGRARELTGIGPGIEARLRELVETGRLAELEELERTVSPELVGFGRFLGLGSRRALEIARALGVTTGGAGSGAQDGGPAA
ncbi:MAG: hypothetical protein E6G67_04390 [Actinobacteria bacterium]|nr:MAG: hypothetical protein E6G67_04390 [Actinomycetota bacterium]